MLSAAIMDNTYQTSNAAYSAVNVPLTQMKVYRTVDGGAVKPNASW